MGGLQEGRAEGDGVAVGAWGVICRAEADYEGVTGLVVIITDGEVERAVGHVGFVRQTSQNPDVTFQDQLQVVLDRADEAVTTLTELQDVFDVQQQEAERTVEQAIAAFREQMDDAASALRENVRVAMSDALGKPTIMAKAQ